MPGARAGQSACAIETSPSGRVGIRSRRRKRADAWTMPTLPPPQVSTRMRPVPAGRCGLPIARHDGTQRHADPRDRRGCDATWTWVGFGLPPPAMHPTSRPQMEGSAPPRSLPVPCQARLRGPVQTRELGIRFIDLTNTSRKIRVKSVRVAFPGSPHIVLIPQTGGPATAARQKKGGRELTGTRRCEPRLHRRLQRRRSRSQSRSGINRTHP